MFSHRIEVQAVYINITVHLFKETAGRSEFLHDEMAYAGNHLRVIGGKYPFQGSVTQSDRNEVKRRFGGGRADISVCYRVFHGSFRINMHFRK